MEKKDIQDTKEVLVGLIALVKVVAEELKDGFQLQDLIDMFSKINGDPEKKKALELALKDIHDVPAEVKDIDLIEAGELVILLVQELPGLLDAFKKEEAAA